MDGIVYLPDPDGRGWRLFRSPVEILRAESVAEVRPALARLEEATERRGLHAAGLITYEASRAFGLDAHQHVPGGFPLLWFGLYQAFEEADRLPVTPANSFTLGSWEPSISREAYEDAFLRVKEYIADGHTYQVNLTMRLRADFSGDPSALFGRLYDAQPTPHGAYVAFDRHAVCSASPELFFERQGDLLRSRPMKGTAKRGLWSAQDEERAFALQASEKDRAENVMIVDMIRNDLGRVAEQGSVIVPRLWDVERYPTVWQMTSTVEARSSAGLAAVFDAIFPCASITGAPKHRTMQIIRELEPEPRGLYTGTIGYVAPGGDASFNVAIRTVVVDRERGTAEYGTGGGVVWDSRAGSEYEECLTKAAILQSAMRAGAPRGGQVAGQPVGGAAGPQPGEAAGPQGGGGAGVGDAKGFELLETMRWTPEKEIALLDRHLERMAASAAYFAFPFDEADAMAAIEPMVEEAAGPMRVRLLLDRSGSFRAEATPLEILAADEDAPVRIGMATEHVDPGDVFLYHKTTRRDVYDLAAASRPECDDVILYNERGEVTESALANLVIELDGDMVTPPLECGLLPGTLRTELLAQGMVRERVVTREELHRAEAVYLVSALRGLRRAELIDTDPSVRDVFFNP